MLNGRIESVSDPFFRMTPKANRNQAPLRALDDRLMLVGKQFCQRRVRE
jgi:hypothetical protein